MVGVTVRVPGEDQGTPDTIVEADIEGTEDLDTIDVGGTMDMDGKTTGMGRTDLGGQITVMTKTWKD